MSMFDRLVHDLRLHADNEPTKRVDDALMYRYHARLRWGVTVSLVMIPVDILYDIIGDSIVDHASVR